MMKKMKKKQCHILIMDNDKKTADEMTSVLRKQGYCVGLVEHKSKLLTMIKNNMIDVLILNVDAGVTKKYNILSTIKNIDRLLPIIVTSSDDSMEVAARVREQGIFFFTLKPLDLSEMKVVIKNALNRRFTNRGTTIREQYQGLLSSDMNLDNPGTNDLYSIQKHLNWIMAFFVHECKGTLGAVMMNISALVDRNIGRRIGVRKQGKMLLSSLCSLKMLHDMIRNYVISYIGENKRLPCSKKRTDMYRDCLEPVIREFRPMLEKNEMKIIVNKKGDCMADCDSELMRIGIGNLLNNAIKYGTTGTAIYCDLAAYDDNLRFIVINQGIGVEQERLSDIFEKFTRFDRVGISGTGLGLHVVKMIADVHGGSIKAESGDMMANTFLPHNGFENYNARYVNQERSKKYAKFVFEIPAVLYGQGAEVKNERTKSSSYC
jgi:CheY-like chemotaxis protein